MLVKLCQVDWIVTRQNAHEDTVPRYWHHHSLGVRRAGEQEWYKTSVRFGGQRYGVGQDQFLACLDRPAKAGKARHPCVAFRRCFDNLVMCIANLARQIAKELWEERRYVRCDVANQIVPTFADKNQHQPFRKCRWDAGWRKLERCVPNGVSDARGELRGIQSEYLPQSGWVGEQQLNLVHEARNTFGHHAPEMVGAHHKMHDAPGCHIGVDRTSWWRRAQIVNGHAKVALEVGNEIVERRLSVERFLGIKPLLDTHISDSDKLGLRASSMKPGSLGLFCGIVEKPTLEETRHVVLAFTSHDCLTLSTR